MSQRTSEGTSQREGPARETGPDLICYAEPDGAAGWVSPVTGAALRLETNGVYRVSRHCDGYDHDVILGQLSVGDTSARLAAPASVEARELAWELIRIVDDFSGPAATSARGA